VKSAKTGARGSQMAATERTLAAWDKVKHHGSIQLGGYVMSRPYRIVLPIAAILIVTVVIVASYARWTHLRSPQSVAIEDSSTVWIALLKGFNGDVVYVGSYDSYAYFRLGSFFWSYYKVPACAARLPETFPVGRRSGYVVQLHFENGNIHNLVSECTKYEGHALGELDRK
jgi:hypothetical protein